ncbi:hypothetical protein NUU61_003458 [Penicillium alfredii]|uniref:Uncharacterized protein n=1 Tax=Penicillium alfredii TaxID=1506179 RepID=A0A9W9KCY5_9EURO|nr:uncharacterized protein NUU61_003458 [Penicillium alfredii]KAJ5101236.1 hypothetical protein NUU61_003458 [Penicillium alfredii]
MLTPPKLDAILVALVGACTAITSPSLLVASPGETAVLPGWKLRPATTSDDVHQLSQPGADVSSWYRMSARGTVMAGLIENGVYETELFYSNNRAPTADIDTI